MFGTAVAALAALSTLGWWALFVGSIVMIRRWRSQTTFRWDELGSHAGLDPDVLRALVDEGLIVPLGGGRYRADPRTLEAARGGVARLIYSLPANLVLSALLSGMAGYGGWLAWTGAPWTGLGLVIGSWALILPGVGWAIVHGVRHAMAGEPEAPPAPPSRPGLPGDRWM